jgi:hypothetical protein
MADTVLNTTVFDGSKKLITHFNVVSDGTGSTTKIVDVSALATSPAGKTCTKVRLNKISCNVSVTAPVDALRLLWDASSDVNITLPACTSGDSGTVVCEWIKVYE